MTFDPPLRAATLIKRYKRFLADIRLDDGTETTIHVANTGAMTGCAEPGSTIYYSTSDNSKRKYPLSWELTETENGELICVNTIRANQIIEEALKAGRIKALREFTEIQREVPYGNEGSKIDFLARTPPSQKGSEEAPRKAYVEVKSVTLLEHGQGYFPDAKTKRGQKHLRELTHAAQLGQRAILLFAVMHSGINSVVPAKHIDPEYAKLFHNAIAAGVEVIVYPVSLSPKELI